METKCDAATLETGRRLQADFDDRLALRDSIDPHFTKLWLDYAIKGFGRRNVLDERTRFLILIGQFTMTRNAEALAETLRAALHAEVPPRETLEVILQSVVYGGNSVVDFALMIFAPIAREFGVLEALRAERPPLEANDAKRSMDESGYKDFIFGTDTCLLAPAKTQPEVVKWLQTEAIKALSKPDIKEKLYKAGFQARPLGGAHAGTRLMQEIKTYKSVIDQAGIQKM